jgi:hypothetical protein
MNIEKKEIIRAQLLQNLEDYGVFWDEKNQQLLCDDFRKVQYKLAKHINPQKEKYEGKIEEYVAKPEDINILDIDPYLKVVQSNNAEDCQLWAYATSFWSVPVTVGFGRRIRLFIFDRQNDKLIGIIGLADPIIGLNVRDKESIGWTKNQKLKRLYSCMTAYILGAIPPYNSVLGAKMVALSLMFPEVRTIFYEKYEDRAHEKGKSPYLAYIDTLGAFGKSSIYTRLKGWDFIGYTKGQSHLHITANGSWELIKEVVDDDVFQSYKFGDGPNWKMRVLKAGLRELGLSENMLGIGWKRGYYRLPLAENWQSFLLGETNQPIYKDVTKSDLIEYWKTRWVIPRLEKLQHNLSTNELKI